MENIVAISGKRRFTLQQAESVLPIIYRVTEDAAGEVRSLMNKLKAFPDRQTDGAKAYEAKAEQIIEIWHRKIEALGAEPKGLWLVDFDKGDGYWCWKYPENKISFWHGYQDGFSGRMMVEQNSTNTKMESTSHENCYSPNEPHPG